jgi:hypothetical protein
VATLKISDFVLEDTRLIEISAKRLLAPSDMTEKSWTRAQLDGHCPLPTRDAPGEYAGLTLKMSLEGFLDESDAEEKKSFHVETEAQYLFKSRTPGYVSADEAEGLITLFIAQSFPLQMDKMRRIAQDMGFDGASPQLGAQLAKSRISAVASDTAPSPSAKKHMRSKRSQSNQGEK